MFRNLAFFARRSTNRFRNFPRPPGRALSTQPPARNRHYIPTFLVAANLLDLIQGKKFDEKEETAEEKLIMNIKRGILWIQRGEYKKAEQMLHVALKMAQDLQSTEGITYIYDVLANLAMEAGDYKKAEKLFRDVMQRLFGAGYTEDNIKMLHLSAKMAHLFHFQGKTDEAIDGFKWTLEKIEQNLRTAAEDSDFYELLGLVKNWYAQLLVDKKNFAEAKRHFEEAFEIYKKIHGEKTAEAVLILNNLSVMCSEMGDIAEAIQHLKGAIELAKDIPDMAEALVMHANLGMLYLKQGLYSQAKESCDFAHRLGLKSKNDDAVKHGSYCLDRIRKFQNEAAKASS